MRLVAPTVLALTSLGCHATAPPSSASEPPRVAATVAPIAETQTYLIEHPVPSKVVTTDELAEGMERAEQARAARIAEGAALHEGDVVIGSKRLLQIREHQLMTLSPAIDALRTCYQKSKARTKTMHGRLVFTIRYARDVLQWGVTPKPSRVTSVTTSLREDTISVDLERCSAEAIRRLTTGSGSGLWMPLHFVDED